MCTAICKLAMPKLGWVELDTVVMVSEGVGGSWGYNWGVHFGLGGTHWEESGAEQAGHKMWTVQDVSPWPMVECAAIFVKSAEAEANGDE